jgi:hypothetical protein
MDQSGAAMWCVSHSGHHRGYKGSVAFDGDCGPLASSVFPLCLYIGLVIVVLPKLSGQSHKAMATIAVFSFIKFILISTSSRC